MKFVICLFALFVITHGAPGTLDDVVNTIKDNASRGAKAVASNVAGCSTSIYYF